MQYENCVANACESGYVYLASPSSTKPKSKVVKQKRSYMMRFPTKGQGHASQTAAGGQESTETAAPMMEDAGLDMGIRDSISDT